MNFARKLCLVAASAALGIGMIAMSPTSGQSTAGDSSWGCGGPCRLAPSERP